MPYYVEFPFDPVVNVHWKKKDGPPDGGGRPSQQHITCGAWVKSMYYEYLDIIPLPPNGFSYWVLYPGAYRPPFRDPPDPLHPPKWYDGALYGQGMDTTPGHAPDEPAGYFELVRPPIYLWTEPPGGWTVTYHYTDFPHYPVRIGVWRGYSLHTLVKANYAIPPTQMSGSDLHDVSMNILPDPVRDNGFPPVFALVAGPGGAWGVGLGVLLHTIPEIVQAHCCVDHAGAPVAGPCVEETTGEPPPPPWNDEDGPQDPPYQYKFSDPVYPYPVP